MDIGDFLRDRERWLERLDIPLVSYDEEVIRVARTHRASLQLTLHFPGEFHLDIHETIDTSLCRAEFLSYSYQLRLGVRPIFRYDDAPHREVGDHKHVFNHEDNVQPSQRPGLAALAREVEAHVTQGDRL